MKLDKTMLTAQDLCLNNKYTVKFYIINSFIKTILDDGKSLNTYTLRIECYTESQQSQQKGNKGSEISTLNIACITKKYNFEYKFIRKAAQQSLKTFAKYEF